MSEPIVLFDADGREVVVHGRAQASVLVEQQGFTWERPAPGGKAADAPSSPPGGEAADAPSKPKGKAAQ